MPERRPFLALSLFAIALPGCVEPGGDNQLGEGTSTEAAGSVTAYAGDWTLIGRLETQGSGECGAEGSVGEEFPVSVRVGDDGAIFVPSPEPGSTERLLLGNLAASGSVTLIDNTLMSKSWYDGTTHHECPAGAGTGSCSSNALCTGTMPDRYGNVYSWRMVRPAPA